MPKGKRLDPLKKSSCKMNPNNWGPYNYNNYGKQYHHHNAHPNYWNYNYNNNCYQNNNKNGFFSQQAPQNTLHCNNAQMRHPSFGGWSQNAVDHFSLPANTYPHSFPPAGTNSTASFQTQNYPHSQQNISLAEGSNGPSNSNVLSQPNFPPPQYNIANPANYNYPWSQQNTSTNSHRNPTSFGSIPQQNFPQQECYRSASNCNSLTQQQNSTPTNNLNNSSNISPWQHQNSSNTNISNGPSNPDDPRLRQKRNKHKHHKDNHKDNHHKDKHHKDKHKDNHHKDKHHKDKHKDNHHKDKHCKDKQHSKPDHHHRAPQNISLGNTGSGTSRISDNNPLAHHINSSNCPARCQSSPAPTPQKQHNTTANNNAELQHQHSIPVFQKGNVYLNFILEDAPQLYTTYKIDGKDKSEFLKKVKFATHIGENGNKFSEAIDKWPTRVDKTTVVNAAKHVILVAYKYKRKGRRCVQKVIMKKFEAKTGLLGSVSKRMTILYFIYLIMVTETVNDHLRRGQERPLCNFFEYRLSDPQKDIFRKLVQEATYNHKQEFFSLKCRLRTYFSKKRLEIFDRADFWKQISAGRNISGTTVDPQIHDIATTDDECSEIEDEDDLGSAGHAIDVFLNPDWLIEFPISESDKQRFTEKYSIERLSGNDTVFLYGKGVEFNDINLLYSIVNLFPSVEKRKLIEMAKEAFYAEKIFGKQKASVIAEILRSQMAERKNSDEGSISLPERLIALLVVHIIMCAESIQSSYRNNPKSERPFCAAFSTNSFVMNFKHLVSCIKSKKNRRKLYWMRLIWESCLSDKHLLKIDRNNFWGTLGIKPSALPAKLIPKRKTLLEVSSVADDVAIIAEVDKNDIQDEEPVVVIFSSDDEDNETQILTAAPRPKEINQPVDSIDNTDNVIKEMEEFLTEINASASTSKNANRDPAIKNKNYVLLFQQNRQKWWADNFDMKTECINKLCTKYNFRQQARNKSNELTDLDFYHLSITLFRKTVFDVFPFVDTEKLFQVTKEAFCLATKIGYGFVYEVVDYLTQQMLEGVDLLGPAEWKLTSRLIAFLAIHFIISAESIDPFIIPNIKERSFQTALYQHQQTIQCISALIGDIENNELRKKLHFLSCTWVPYKCFDSVPEEIAKMYQSNCYKEQDHIKDIIEFTISTYNSAKDLIDKEQIVSSESDESVGGSVKEINSWEGQEMESSKNSTSDQSPAFTITNKEKKKRRVYRRILSDSSDSEDEILNGDREKITEDKNRKRDSSEFTANTVNVRSKNVAKKQKNKSVSNNKEVRSKSNECAELISDDKEHHDNSESLESQSSKQIQSKCKNSSSTNNTAKKRKHHRKEAKEPKLEIVEIEIINDKDINCSDPELEDSEITSEESNKDCKNSQFLDRNGNSSISSSDVCSEVSSDDDESECKHRNSEKADQIKNPSRSKPTNDSSAFVGDRAKILLNLEKRFPINFQKAKKLETRSRTEKLEKKLKQEKED